MKSFYKANPKIIERQHGVLAAVKTNFPVF